MTIIFKPTNWSDVQAVNPRDTEKLYFFQFPSPFPTFAPAQDDIIDVDAPETPETGQKSPESKGKAKAVSWAAGVKKEEEDDKSRVRDNSKNPHASQIDGVIGQMEMYSNGEVKIRLGEGVLMTVSLCRTSA